MLVLNYELTVFNQTFSFLTEATRDAATELAFNCDSVREFKSLLNAEEVFYKAESCKYKAPVKNADDYCLECGKQNCDCISNHQMSLL